MHIYTQLICSDLLIFSVTLQQSPLHLLVFSIMSPRPRLTLLDYGHRAIVTTCAAASVYGLWAIWQIHNANIAAGAEYMRVLKIEQDKARAQGRTPPERLDKPASYYARSNESLSE